MESVGHSFLQGVEEALKNISNKHLGYNPSEKSEFLKKDNSSINYDAKQQSTFSAKEKVVTERQGKALTKLADDFYKTNRSNMILVLGTADIVDRLLSLNTKNRNVDRKQVIALAHEIIEGKWKDVSAVVVANTGVLLDGQHRLHAIKEAGYPRVKFWLQVGVDESYRDAIDQGKRRMVKDVLKLQDNVDYNDHLSSAINFLTKVTPRFTMLANPVTNSVPRARSLYLDFYEELGEEGIAALEPILSKPKFRKAPITAALFQYSAIEPDHANKLCQAIAHGRDLAADSPILAFRNYFLENPKIASNQSKMKLYRKMVATILAERKGKKLKIVAQDVSSWGDLTSDIWFPVIVSSV